ncbi:MAG: hypothetical protein AAGM67_21830, partial [Bacteroidota bacterium]
MGIEHRPYVGTWSLNRQRVVQHTPDALVYINGSTSIPGCARCNGRINLQEFITSVSVEAGVQPGGHSANLSLSIPSHHHETFIRDARSILRPGLEVHIYMRGYFPMKGLYDRLTLNQAGANGTQSRLDSLGLNGTGLEEVVNYPYYHVFHGVITQVDPAYSGGVNTMSISCASMLHFWNYHNISTNASLFG